MKFDLHVHTADSPDSPASPAEMISAAKKAGLSGMAIANHDVLTKAECGDDFTLIPACEYTTDAGHLLCYFIKEDVSDGLTKDSRGRYPWRQIVECAHSQGALVFLAHPYAPEPPGRDEAVFCEIDGIEIYNARIEHSRAKGANLRAQKKAAELNIAFSSGSDAHFPEEVGAAYWECDDGDDVYEALKNGRGRVYGGTSSPVWRIYSQWIKLFRLRAWKVAPKLIPRTVRTVLICLKPKRKPVLIDFPERKD